GVWRGEPWGSNVHNRVTVERSSCAQGNRFQHSQATGTYFLERKECFFTLCASACEQGRTLLVSCWGFPGKCASEIQCWLILRSIVHHKGSFSGKADTIPTRTCRECRAISVRCAQALPQNFRLPGLLFRLAELHSEIIASDNQSIISSGKNCQ